MATIQDLEVKKSTFEQLQCTKQCSCLVSNLSWTRNFFMKIWFIFHLCLSYHDCYFSVYGVGLGIIVFEPSAKQFLPESMFSFIGSVQCISANLKWSVLHLVFNDFCVHLTKYWLVYNSQTNKEVFNYHHHLLQPEVQVCNSEYKSTFHMLNLTCLVDFLCYFS